MLWGQCVTFHPNAIFVFPSLSNQWRSIHPSIYRVTSWLEEERRWYMLQPHLWRRMLKFGKIFFKKGGGGLVKIYRGSSTWDLSGKCLKKDVKKKLVGSSDTLWGSKFSTAEFYLCLGSAGSWTTSALEFCWDSSSSLRSGVISPQYCSGVRGLQSKEKKKHPRAVFTLSCHPTQYKETEFVTEEHARDRDIKRSRAGRDMRVKAQPGDWRWLFW